MSIESNKTKQMEENKMKQTYKSILVSPETKKEFDMIKSELQISQDETLMKLIKIYEEEKKNDKN